MIAGPKKQKVFSSITRSITEPIKETSKIMLSKTGRESVREGLSITAGAVKEVARNTIGKPIKDTFEIVRTSEGRASVREGLGITAGAVKEVIHKSMIDYFKSNTQILTKIPTFYKLTFLVLFYLFFYKIFYDIGIYFGLNYVELILYMSWFGILILLLAFLNPVRSRLYS